VASDEFFATLSIWALPQVGSLYEPSQAVIVRDADIVAEVLPGLTEPR
jgi:hypothetical protein